MGRIKNETLDGVKWKMLQGLMMRPLHFFYLILLARLVSPAEIGVLALTSLFFDLAGCLTYCGLSTALIRKQDRTEADCSTVFWYNVVVSGTLMLLFWAASPLFAAYFCIPDLCPLTIVASAFMFVESTGSVHFTLYTAQRNFKTPTILTLLSTFVSLPMTIALAYLGFSYWSITLSNGAAILITTIGVWIVSPWRPRLIFSRQSFREFFLFGVKLTLTNIVNNIFDGTRNMIIGKMYNTAQLALYNRAFKFCTLPLAMIDRLWKGVALPVLATIQDDEPRLISVYTKYIRFSSMVIQGGMMTLVANAHSLVYCLYGETWMTCVPYVQVLCFAVMFNPITYINENIYIVKNRADALLRREITMRLFGITVIGLGALHSMMAVCFTAIVSDIFCCFLSLYTTSRIISITISAQVKAFVPYILLAMLANVPAYFINRLDYSPFILAPVGVAVSACIYYCLLKAMHDPCLDEFMVLLKEQVLAKLPFLKRFVKGA